VTYYLKPLFPVELPIEGILGLFTVVAEPTPPWLAVSGLLLFAALVLAFACWRIRRLEVLYSSDWRSALLVRAGMDRASPRSLSHGLRSLCCEAVTKPLDASDRRA